MSLSPTAAVCGSGDGGGRGVVLTDHIWEPSLLASHPGALLVWRSKALREKCLPLGTNTRSAELEEEATTWLSAFLRGCCPHGRERGLVH